MQHHDTITGTSYQYVNDDFIFQIDNHTVNDTKWLLNSKVASLALDQGLNLTNLTYCLHRLNERYLLCPVGGLELNSEIYLAVYNPGMEDSQLLTLYLNTSKVEITAWFPYTRSYLPVTAEAFCYTNLDTQSGTECEIKLRHKIISLSLSILRIRPNPSVDI